MSIIQGRRPDTESNGGNPSSHYQLPKHIAVIGAGIMGMGVAQTFASHGFKITLIDNNPAVCETALKSIRQQLRAFKLTHPSQTIIPVKEIVDNITVCEELSALEGVDYVIENISESIEKKTALYQHANQHLTEHCIVVANTSAIPIKILAEHLNHPHNLLGIHFMNPVPLKNTVELIVAPETSERATEITRLLLRAVNKKAIQVADKPGFVSNRILMLTINEAIQTLADDVGSAQSIDAVFSECFGHPMGPLATADLIGLDVIRDTLLVLQNQYNDQKYCPAPLLENLVAAGQLGRKSGQGFFSY